MVIVDARLAMDPWGGSAREAGVEADASVLGFDDDFSVDAVNDPSNATPNSSSDSTVNNASSISPSSINFIPRIQNRANDSTLTSSSSSSSFPSLAPLKDPLTDMMTSEEYISRLEAKLKRIKGGGGGGSGRGGRGGGRKALSSSAKQMIDAFTIAKESTAVHVIDGCSAPSDSSRMELNPNIFLQRAFPERTPLTQEELEWLVNHDELQPPDDQLQPSDDQLEERE